MKTITNKETCVSPGQSRRNEEENLFRSVKSPDKYIVYDPGMRWMMYYEEVGNAGRICHMIRVDKRPMAKAFSLYERSTQVPENAPEDSQLRPATEETAEMCELHSHS